MNAPVQGSGEGGSPTAMSERVFIGADHPAFQGHFPGRPILPGVALLAAVMEAARARPALAARIGAAPRIGVVKFSAVVAPATALEIVFTPSARALAWHVVDGDRQVASGEFSDADVGPSS